MCWQNQTHTRKGLSMIALVHAVGEPIFSTSNAHGMTDPVILRSSDDVRSDDPVWVVEDNPPNGATGGEGRLSCPAS